MVSDWMRPKEIVKEKHLDCAPCLFSGTANPSDVCQVLQSCIFSSTPHRNVNLSACLYVLV